MRLFAFTRIMTGDELSKRAKFALITWIGPQVSVLKRAKMSTDKSLLKSVVQVRDLSLCAEKRKKLTTYQRGV